MGKHKPETRKRLNAEYRERNRAKLAQDNRDWRAKVKLDVLNHYGLECAVCGYSDIRALQIDHIENNGAEERKALGGQQVSGYRFYLILKAQDYPSGYQTLCANCNLIKYIESKRSS